MKIKDIKDLSEGENIEIVALASKVETFEKRNGNEYLSVTIQDRTGVATFPVWRKSSFEENFEEGDVLHIFGVCSVYNDENQIKLTEIRPSELKPEQFTPGYDISNSLIDEFLGMINEIRSPYKEIINELIGFECKTLEDDRKWDIFTTAVSAEKHHGNKRGGLLLHSYGTLKTLNNIIDTYDGSHDYYDAIDVLNVDRMRFKAVMHDIGKVREYESDLGIKRKDVKCNHLIYGVTMIEMANAILGSPLSEEDMDNISYSIMSHHGQWGPYEPKDLEDTLLHLVDMVDSRIVGEIEK